MQDKIRAVQRALRLDDDGKAGPLTWDALYRHFIGVVPAPSDTPAPATSGTGRLDSRSLRNIESLLPSVRPYVHALVDEAAALGIELQVTGGTRTYAEQDALYRQAHDGKDNDGDGRVDESDERVTRAPAGFSNHNFGIAFDVTIFRDGQPLWETPAYKAVGAIGQRIGLEWGGDWTGFKDEPHFQWRPQWAKNLSEAAMLSELRKRKEAGESFL